MKVHKKLRGNDNWFWKVKIDAIDKQLRVQNLIHWYRQTAGGEKIASLTQGKGYVAMQLCLSSKFLRRLRPSLTMLAQQFAANKK